jgi:hypothetical protein
MTINQALAGESLGTLSFNDVMHGYGVTDKGIRVWLPRINTNPEWHNVVLASEGIIVQKGVSSKMKTAIWEPAVVITRDKSKKPTVYNRLPDIYRPFTAIYKNPYLSMLKLLRRQPA